MKTSKGKISTAIRRWILGAGALWLGAMGTAAGIERTIYHHFDALGSPVASTDATGTVVYRERYAPYGARERKEVAGLANTRWYTGHPQDKTTGLVYTGARWYDPQLGRFLGTDPQGVTFTNLQSFNRYAYANNNPYRYVDPDGNVAETVADVISLGLSINSYLQEPSLFNALGVAVDAVGTAVPFLPAGFGTIRAIGRSAEDIVKTTPDLIYRGGSSNPGNLKTRPDESAVSFRDSLSNPIDSKQRPVFKPGDQYIAVDTKKLPPGSVIRDNSPPGHVSVTATPETIRDAVIEKGKFPR